MVWKRNQTHFHVVVVVVIIITGEIYTVNAHQLKKWISRPDTTITIIDELWTYLCSVNLSHKTYDMEVSQKSKSRLNGGYNLLMLKKCFSKTSQNQQSLLCVSMHQMLVYIENRYNILTWLYILTTLYDWNIYSKNIPDDLWMKCGQTSTMAMV